MYTICLRGLDWMLTLDSKSDNDDLKREMESIKAPSAVCVPIFSLQVPIDTNDQQPASHTGGFSENFAASVHLARSGSTQRFACPTFRFYEQNI